MAEANHTYLLDITSGFIRKLIEYLEALADLLRQPAERGSIFPQDDDVPFELPRIRVSVQLSEERLKHDEARRREMERTSVGWTAELEARIYSHRTAEEYKEQAKRTVVEDWEKVRGDIYNPKHKRAVILGDPGFGKTWLLYHEALQLALAEIARLRDSKVGTADVLIPVYVRLASLADYPGIGLVERIKQVLEKDADLSRIPHFSELWPLIKSKIESGKALLLLDGWDEVRSRKEELKKTIQNFAVEKDTDRRIYLTSRIAGYDDILLERTKTKAWELVAFNDQQVKTFVQSYFRMEPGRSNTQTKKGTALLEHLRRTPQLMGLGRIPLMLALLCRIAWQRTTDDVKLPTRRVDIYEKCLWGLVFEWKYERKPSDEDVDIRADRAKTTLRWLSDVCLRLFLDRAHVDVWSRDELKAATKLIEAGPQTEDEAIRWIADLVADGVLVRDGDDVNSPLRFIHRTFQEYLAANTIANRANLHKGAGWDTSRIEISGKQVANSQLIDAKSWDDGWREVMILLAGKLDQPEQLLGLLQNPETDDTLRHRICLAALCVGELSKPRNTALSRHIEDIAMEVFRLWRSGECLRDINRPLAQACADNTKLIDSLADLLRDPDSSLRSGAAWALGQCTQAGADNTKIIDSLAGLLRDQVRVVCSSAAYALGECAQAGADNTKLIDTLAGLLRDPDPDLRSSAAKALGQCAQAGADNTKHIDTLAGLLRDPDPYVCSSAAYALGQCAQAGADNTKLIDTLAGLLLDQESYVRNCAAYALGQCPQAGADIAKHIDTLAGLLRDPDPYVCSSAAKALGQCAQAGADNTKLIDTLAGLLRDPDSDVRSSAAKALGQCAQAGADNTKLIDTLAGLLGDPVSDLRSRAAEALGQCAQAGADIAKHIDTLAGLLRDPDRSVRSRAAEALEKYGVRIFKKQQQHYPWKRVKDLAELHQPILTRSRFGRRSRLG